MFSPSDKYCASPIALADVDLLPVIPNPGVIWCAGMNTHSHFEEAKYVYMVRDPRDMALTWKKAPSAPGGPLSFR